LVYKKTKHQTEQNKGTN